MWALSQSLAVCLGLLWSTLKVDHSRPRQSQVLIHLLCYMHLWCHFSTVRCSIPHRSTPPGDPSHPSTYSTTLLHPSETQPIIVIVCPCTMAVPSVAGWWKNHKKFSDLKQDNFYYANAVLGNMFHLLALVIALLVMGWVGYKGTPPKKKMFSFGHCPNEGGGPCPN